MWNCSVTQQKGEEREGCSAHPLKVKIGRNEELMVKSTKSQSFSQWPWWDQSEIMGFYHKKIIPKPFPHFLLRQHHRGRLLFKDWLLSQWGSSLASIGVHWPVLQEEVEDVLEKVTLNLILLLLSGPLWNSLGGYESGPWLNPYTLIYLGRVER